MTLRPDSLIPLTTEALLAALPDWPFSGWTTGRLIRSGKLGCVRIGVRIFVTPELLAEFIARHTCHAPSKPSAQPAQAGVLDQQPTVAAAYKQAAQTKLESLAPLVMRLYREGLDRGHRERDTLQKIGDELLRGPGRSAQSRYHIARRLVTRPSLPPPKKPGKR